MATDSLSSRIRRALVFAGVAAWLSESVLAATRKGNSGGGLAWARAFVHDLDLRLVAAVMIVAVAVRGLSRRVSEFSGAIGFLGASVAVGSAFVALPSMSGTVLGSERIASAVLHAALGLAFGFAMRQPRYPAVPPLNFDMLRVAQGVGVALILSRVAEVGVEIFATRQTGHAYAWPAWADGFPILFVPALQGIYVATIATTRGTIWPVFVPGLLITAEFALGFVRGADPLILGALRGLIECVLGCFAGVYLSVGNWKGTPSARVDERIHDHAS